MSLESELESKSMLLESELESESHDAGIGIGIGITRYWNRDWNRNHGFWKTLEPESESESTLVESELESESLVPESFTTLETTIQLSSNKTPKLVDILIFKLSGKPKIKSKI